MKKIIALGASNSQQSINQEFAAFALTFFDQFQTDLISLNDFPAPLYGIDYENANGIPESIYALLIKIKAADLIIISLAEHNGSYTTAFKNLFDWLSRAELKFFENKKLLLLSTAPGPRGGLSVMEAAKVRFPIHGAQIVGSFCLPKFAQNFARPEGITDPVLAADFAEQIQAAMASLR